MNRLALKSLVAAGVLAALSVSAFAEREHLPRASAHGATVPAVHRRRAERVAALQWARTGVAPALTGTNGEILYAYGESHPEVRCAPLHLCVIALLPHEKIVNLSLGDSVRWLAQPAEAGDRPVIVIKPTVAGLATNLVVTTSDGHLYYLDLVSSPARFVPEIGFYDPRALVATVNSARALKAAEARRRARTVVASLPRHTRGARFCLLVEGTESRASAPRVLGAGPCLHPDAGRHPLRQCPGGVRGRSRHRAARELPDGRRVLRGR